jgi:hypothetical protein
MTRLLVTDDDIELINTGLTCSELMELWLGPSHVNGSLFSTEEELHDSWVRGRDLMMKEWAKNGHRPLAWWALEASDLGLKYPGYERERSYLYNNDALFEDERDELIGFWKKEFNRSYDPDFFASSAGGVLYGAAARRFHHDWADIPRVLRQQWRKERQCQIKTIRKVEATTNETLDRQP